MFNLFKRLLKRNPTNKDWKCVCVEDVNLVVFRGGDAGRAAAKEMVEAARHLGYDEICGPYEWPVRAPAPTIGVWILSPIDDYRLEKILRKRTGLRLIPYPFE